MARGMTVRYVERDPKAVALRATIQASKTQEQIDREAMIRRTVRREQRLAWAAVTNTSPPMDGLHRRFRAVLDACLPTDMQPYEEFMLANGRPFHTAKGR